MNVMLWAAQLALGLLFTAAGSFKTFQYRRARAVVPWVPHVSRGTTALVGVAELCGGLGLILPALTGIAAPLVSFAALGLGTVMLLAAGFHARRGELKAIPVNLVLLALAVFVCQGRWI